VRAEKPFANLLPRALAARLHKWVGEGRYASLFDNIEDTLTVERFQVFDLEAMRAFPALLEPLLFYVLHRARRDATGGRSTGEGRQVTSRFASRPDANRHKRSFTTFGATKGS
jgi:type IV secretion system protein VirB4